MTWVVDPQTFIREKEEIDGRARAGSVTDAARRAEADRYWIRCYGCQSCEFRCDHYYPADKIVADLTAETVRGERERCATVVEMWGDYRPDFAYMELAAALRREDR